MLAKCSTLNNQICLNFKLIKKFFRDHKQNAVAAAAAAPYPGQYAAAGYEAYPYSSAAAAAAAGESINLSYVAFSYSSLQLKEAQ